MFCVTLANVLVILLLPVRRPLTSALRDVSDRVMRPG